MKNKYLSILIAVLILVGIPVMAQSASVTKTFWGTVWDGPFTGYIGTGSFSYDDKLINNGDEGINPTGGLSVMFSFYSQFFDETNDIDFNGYPELSFDDFIPISLDYVLVNGINGVNFNVPNLAELSMWELFPSSGGYDFETIIYAASVPIPGTLWLLGSGIAALIGLRTKKIYKV
ncbi:MAG: hypothetical protein KKC46_19580 [Proteobacteria bacterium]|nr:hypothetical protein [Pseudomonadota bacterium]